MFFKRLAPYLLQGDWELTSIVAGCRLATGHHGPWSRALGVQLLETFGCRPSLPQLLDALAADPLLRLAQEEHDLRICHVDLTVPTMGANQVPASTVPAMATPGELAHWLGLLPSELDWFADLAGRTVHAQGRLRHYTAWWRGRRLVEAPRTRLKQLQRRIQRGILDHVPPHDAAHGFVRGRSAVTGARCHLGQDVVIGLDLEAFFPSIGVARIRRIFESLGYPERVAALLGGLCTTTTPLSVLTGCSDARQVARHRMRHLPQGAPSSPALANLSLYGFDVRMRALAQVFGATYTRYADDISLSGSGELGRILPYVHQIVEEEGFVLHGRKTRVQRACARQVVTGVVVNVHPSLPRRELERLEAVLFNCVHKGVEGQNREGHGDFEAHLRGRVARVMQVNPRRGAKLQRLFERVVW